MIEERMYPAIKALGVGDSANFPLTRVAYARTAAVNLGLELSRKFSTHIDRELEVITVTREK